MDRHTRIGGPSFRLCEVKGCDTNFYVAGSRDWKLSKCVIHRMEEMRATPEYKQFEASLIMKNAFDVLKKLT